MFTLIIEKEYVSVGDWSSIDFSVSVFTYEIQCIFILCIHAYAYIILYHRKQSQKKAQTHNITNYKRYICSYISVYITIISRYGINYCTLSTRHLAICFFTFNFFSLFRHNVNRTLLRTAKTRWNLRLKACVVAFKISASGKIHAKFSSNPSIYYYCYCYYILAWLR